MFAKLDRGSPDLFAVMAPQFLQSQPRPRSFMAVADAVGARLWHRPGGSVRQGNQAATAALVGLLRVHFAELLAGGKAFGISTLQLWEAHLYVLLPHSSVSLTLSLWRCR